MEQFICKQLDEGYNAQLNSLFEEWLTFVEKEKEHLFCKDGLLVKHKDESCGYDINQKWKEAEKRIMFIVKDCPNGWGYDARRLFVGYPDNEKSIQNAQKTRNANGSFFKNIAKLLYGLSYPTTVHDDIDRNKAAQIKAFDEIPFAFVEAKKIAGQKTCSSAVLQKELEQNGKFLAQEISILKPNIIVCCDNDEIIFNNVVQNYFNGQIPLNDEHKWEYQYMIEGFDCGFKCKLYYYEKEGILLFNSFHPSARIEKWIIYEKVMSPFRHFLEQYKFDIVSAAHK